MMKTKLTIFDKTVFATLAYYDVLDMPLTLFELYLYGMHLGRYDKQVTDTATLAEIMDSLHHLQQCGIVSHYYGYYFIGNDRQKGKEAYQTRIERKKIADIKWRKALRAFRFLKFVPFVRIVFASGSLASYNTDAQSDLDVLFVVSDGRIWTARFLISFVLEMIGMRRTRKDPIGADKVCPNHYLTHSALHMPYQSLYNAQTYAHLTPVLVKDKKLLDAFWKKNTWVGIYMNHWPPKGEDSYHHRPYGIIAKSMSRLFETILTTQAGDWLEQRLRTYQLSHIKKGDQNIGRGRVIITDHALEFHPHSPEKEILDRYNETMRSFGFPAFAREIDSGLA